MYSLARLFWVKFSRLQLFLAQRVVWRLNWGIESRFQLKSFFFNLFVLWPSKFKLHGADTYVFIPWLYDFLLQGITLKLNEEGRCIVARIMHGGMIHRQGLCFFWSLQQIAAKLLTTRSNRTKVTLVIFVVKVFIWPPWFICPLQ